MTRTFLLLLLITTFILSLPFQNSSGAQELSRAETYERFHDVLHPLQHEALPQKNFAEIRRRSGELFERGKAIVKLGVGQVPKAKRTEFAKALRSFDRALATFKADAKSGTDAKLEKSFTAVHDTYEELDALVAMYLSLPSGEEAITLAALPPHSVVRLCLTVDSFNNHWEATPPYYSEAEPRKE